MNPFSEIEWKLNEHKNWLAEIETYRRQLGYEQFDRGDSESMTVRAKRTLIALSAKTRLVVGAAFRETIARPINSSHPETGANQ
jgi:hypothetical protein